MELILNQPIVIDNGSGIIKCGFAGDSYPKCSFTNYVGRTKHVRMMTGGLERDILIGSQAEVQKNTNIQDNKGLFKLDYPMKSGLVTNWNDMELVWNHVYSLECLNISSKEHPVLMTETPLNSAKNSEKMAEILFESFGAPALYFSIPAVLSLYASGRVSGVVLDSGDGVTHVMSVCQGFALNHTVLRDDLAGRDVTDYLKLLLRREGYIFHTSSELEIVKNIKERCCRVLPLREVPKDPMKYTLPDGSVIEMEKSWHRAPEVLFQPSLVGSEWDPIHELLVNSIKRADLDLRSLLFSNIVMAGGSTLIRGFGDRLINEVKVLAPKDIPIKISAPKERIYSAWIGGSILASLETFRRLWFTNSDYKSHGANIFRNKHI